MPVIRDFVVNLTMEEILRWEGFKKSLRVKPSLENLVRELVAVIEHDHILTPAVAYEIYPIAEMRKHQMFLGANRAAHGSLLTSMLRKAKELAAAVCTIGPRLEKRATEYFHKNEPLRGMLLDGIGSAAIHSLGGKVHRLIMHKALSRGSQASSTFRPGISGFPISEQWHLFELVQAKEIDVSLTASGTMVPRMSISMVIGIGPQMITWTQAELCARCGMRKNCLYRVNI